MGRRSYGKKFMSNLTGSLNIHVRMQLLGTSVKVAANVVILWVWQLAKVVGMDVAVPACERLETVVGLFGAHAHVNHQPHVGAIAELLSRIVHGEITHPQELDQLARGVVFGRQVLGDFEDLDGRFPLAVERIGESIFQDSGRVVVEARIVELGSVSRVPWRGKSRARQLTPPPVTATTNGGALDSVIDCCRDMVAVLAEKILRR